MSLVTGTEKFIKTGRIIRQPEVGRKSHTIYHNKVQTNHKLDFLKYNHAYVNNETRLRIDYNKQQRCSPSINTFEEAERCLKDQKNQRLNLDNIERPNTKRVFVKVSNIAAKVILVRQPLLRTDPLPDWLYNLARGRV